MKLQLCVLSTLSLHLFVLTAANPFLFSTSQWFFNKLFNSTIGSTGTNDTPNIEDLSEQGPMFQHINKSIISARVENLVGQEPMNDTAGAGGAGVLIPGEEEQETPGILHRKISKILNKLQLYSAVRSTIHNVRKQQEEEQTGSGGIGGSSTTMKTGDRNDNEESEEFIKLQRILNESKRPPQQVQEPAKFYLPLAVRAQSEDNNGIDERLLFDDEREDNADKNKLSLETGNIGIHIMEIFGSIATILLTAAYQVGNYASALTQSSAPTMITSEPIAGMSTTIDFV